MELLKKTFCQKKICQKNSLPKNFSTEIFFQKIKKFAKKNCHKILQTKKKFHNAKTLQKMPQEKNIITYEKMMS